MRRSFLKILVPIIFVPFRLSLCVHSEQVFVMCVGVPLYWARGVQVTVARLTPLILTPLMGSKTISPVSGEKTCVGDAVETRVHLHLY